MSEPMSRQCPDNVPARTPTPQWTGWNVLCLEPGREQTVAAHLIRRGLTGYLPTVHVRYRVGPCRRPMHRDRPMFPGYAFLRAGHGRWDLVHAAPGFIRCLLNGNEPAELSDATISIVRETEANLLAASHQKKKCWDFRVGDLVRFTRKYAPFDGMSGLLQRLDRRDQAVIEILLPGRAVRINTSAQWLRRIG